MAPLLGVNGRLLTRDASVSSDIRSQWSNPTDILSLLLLVGGDVVQRALAQETGEHGLLPPPVVFSFGWVAYAFCALLAAMGDQSFMPRPELQALVLNVQSGYHRSNQSWIIARLIRDFEELWMPEEVKTRLGDVLRAAAPGRTKAGLCISVFEARRDATAGVPKRDTLWYSGYGVAVLQLVIAVVPWAMTGAWETFAITASGTILAFFTASLSHWKKERWACGRKTKKTLVLTRGNGAQHAIAIIGGGEGLDLEDLAAPCGIDTSSEVIKLVYSMLTIAWCVILITVGGLQDNTWFLVSIGAIGMVHTVIVAGVPRRPEHFGVHLQYRTVFVETKVMKALQAAETAFPGLGRCMVQTFFPGDLRPDEIEWWERAREIERKAKKRPPTGKGTSSSGTSSSSSTKTTAGVGTGIGTGQVLNWDENEWRCCQRGV